MTFNSGTLLISSSFSFLIFLSHSFTLSPLLLNWTSHRLSCLFNVVPRAFFPFVFHLPFYLFFLIICRYNRFQAQLVVKIKARYTSNTKIGSGWTNVCAALWTVQYIQTKTGRAWSLFFFVCLDWWRRDRVRCAGSLRKIRVFSCWIGNYEFVGISKKMAPSWHFALYQCRQRTISHFFYFCKLCRMEYYSLLLLGKAGRRCK